MNRMTMRGQSPVGNTLCVKKNNGIMSGLASAS